MIDRTIITVETTNYETFEDYPNAIVFMTKYEENKLAFDEVVFSDQNEFANAIIDLNQLNLNYRIFYDRLFESDEELISYGALYVIFSSEPDLLKNDRDNGFILNRKKIKGFDIRKDFKTNKLVVSDAMRTFLKSFSINFDYTKIDTIGSIDYFIINNISELENSQIPEADGVKESENIEFPGYYCTGTNGIIRLTKDAVEEIKEKQMVVSNHFYFQGKRYASNSGTIICTGEIAYQLKQFLQSNPRQLEIFVPFID